MTEIFMSGRSAMSGAGRWPFASYVSADFRTVDIAPWPSKETGTTVFGSGGWAISKSTENIPLAIELIKDLAAIETDMEAVSIGTSLPARRAATENELFNSFPANASLYFDSLQDIKPVPSPANFAEVESIFMRHMGQIMANSLTPEQGLEMAHNELTIAMDKLMQSMSS